MFSVAYGGAKRFLKTIAVSLHHRTDIVNCKLAQDNHVLKSSVLFYTTRPPQESKQSKNKSQRFRHGAFSPKTEQKESTFWQEDRTILTSLHHSKMKVKEKISSILRNHSAEAYVNSTPPSIKPYLQLIRADKPTGTFLLYFPCAFSICLAATPGELPDFYYLGLFGVGAFLMRGAGCIINDLWDRDIDKRVERTQFRPLASGAVTPKNAVKLLAANLTLSLGILLSLNPTCIMIGFASMIPVILYPLAKRYTNYPQVVLGMTFNIGALMGYTAVTGHLEYGSLTALYASCILWTMYYDTIYAFQDVADDERIGVKSMARLFSRRDDADEFNISERMDFEADRQSKISMFLWCTGGCHIALIALAGFSIDLEGPFYLALAIVALRMGQEAMVLEASSRDSCWTAFKNTKWHGLILTLGIISAIYVKIKPKSSKSRIDQQ